MHEISLIVDVMHTTNHIYYLISYLDIPSYMLAQKCFYRTFTNVKIARFRNYPYFLCTEFQRN